MALPKLTIGIEEEYQIIHPETRELTSYIQEFLHQGQIVLKDQLKPEFLQSQIEVQLAGGVPYYFLVAAWDSQPSGSLVLRIARVDAVGGISSISELPDEDLAAALEVEGSSGLSAPVIGAIVAGAVTVVVALGGAAWRARRRRSYA